MISTVDYELYIKKRQGNQAQKETRDTMKGVRINPPKSPLPPHTHTQASISYIGVEDLSFSHLHETLLGALGRSQGNNGEKSDDRKLHGDLLFLLFISAKEKIVGIESEF
jgi:hypothetical protein